MCENGLVSRNRYSRRAEGLWRMRRHRPVIAQSTDAVNKISSCMLISSHTMRCAALHRETIWVRHSVGPPFRGITVIITLTLTLSLTITPFKVIQGHRVWYQSKAHIRLPITVNWTFFARCYGWGATSDYWLKIGDFVPMGVGWPKISGRRGRPPPTILLLRKLG